MDTSLAANSAVIVLRGDQLTVFTGTVDRGSKTVSEKRSPSPDALGAY
jgi:hypothetical protein